MKKFFKLNKKKTMDDYFVDAVVDTYKNNPIISHWVNYHTHGLLKHGLKSEISLVLPKDDKRAPKVINQVALMMLNGEKFDLNSIHLMYGDNDDPDYYFILLETTCYGEKTLRIILENPETHEIPFPTMNNEDGSEYVLQFSSIFEIEEDKSR